MFRHEKQLLFPVQVRSANPQHAAAVLEQFGGANGELKACLQYFVQSFSCQDAAIKDLMLDIATEEISHLEMVGTCITQLMGGPDVDPNDLSSQQYEMASEAMVLTNASKTVNGIINSNSTTQQGVVLAGHGPALVNSAGSPFTGNFINSVGDILADLSSDFAAELRARKVYEELHRHVADPGAREMFDFLIQREEAHALLFDQAMERAKDVLGQGKSFGNQKYSLAYPELSQPGPGPQTFQLSPDAGVITGPFSGSVDGDTFEPPTPQQ